MKALVLAAGFGSRLGNLTQNFPKPLIEVDNQPILDFTIKKLMEIGISEIIINTHFKSDLIEEFISNQPYSNNIILSHEEKLLGTLGTLKKHINYLSDSDFLVTHSDNYYKDNLFGLVAAHGSKQNHIVASMATFRSSEPEKCGIVKINLNNEVTDFYEKITNPPSNLANAAIYIFDPVIKNIVNQISKSKNDISKDLIPLLTNKMIVHEFKEELIDIGTLNNLNLAREKAKFSTGS